MCQHQMDSYVVKLFPKNLRSWIALENSKRNGKSRMFYFLWCMIFWKENQRQMDSYIVKLLFSNNLRSWIALKRANRNWKGRIYDFLNYLVNVWSMIAFKIETPMATWRSKILYVNGELDCNKYINYWGKSPKDSKPIREPGETLRLSDQTNTRIAKLSVQVVCTYLCQIHICQRWNILSFTESSVILWIFCIHFFIILSWKGHSLWDLKFQGKWEIITLSFQCHNFIIMKRYWQWTVSILL